MLTVLARFSNSFEGVKWGTKNVKNVGDVFFKYQCESDIDEESTKFVHVVSELPEFTIDIVVRIAGHVQRLCRSL
jgi:hypothetical protein